MSSGSHPTPAFHLTPVAWFCRSLGCAWLLLLSWSVAPAGAQTVATRIVADPGAPASQRATVLTTANGTVQVDIRTPSAAGVSRNTYRQFDVGAGGAILNNSRHAVQTQQGGWVQANPWLAKGSARIILNEVNANDPSHLQGYVEVAGSRAQVVIANPSGIAINGGGFINASQVVLTTGTPVVGANGLERFQVQGGVVRIDGTGLDTREADYTAILSRATQVNAGLWAKQLQVVTGPNDIQASTVAPGAVPMATPLAGSGAAPSYALDVSALGGMYAGAIRLLGTEAGVGVRNAGLLKADTDALTLSQEGWLSNTGRMQAAADVTVQAREGLEQQGRVYGGGQVRIESEADQVHGGTVAGQGDVQIVASGSTSRVTASQAAVWAAGVQADGVLGGSGSLDVLAGDRVQSSGQLLATRGLRVDADAVDLSRSQVQASTVMWQARQGDLVATDSEVLAGEKLQLQAAQTLATSGAHMQASQFDIQARQVVHDRGRLHATGDLVLRAVDLDNGAAGEIAADGLVRLSLDGHFTNRGLVDGQDTRIQAQAISNTGTGRIYGDRLALSADTLRNQEDASPGAPVAAVIAGRERVDFGVQTLVNREQALIYSGGDMAIGGMLDSEDRATGAARLVDNRSATIEAAQALRVEADEVRNADAHFATEVQRTGAGTSITEYQHQPGDVVRSSDNATRFDPQDVHVSWCEAQCLTSPAGTSDAFVRYDYTRTVDESVVTRSAPARLLAGADLHLVAGRVLNDNSHILAGGRLDLQAAALDEPAAQGTRTQTDTGTVTSFWRVRQKGTDTHGSATSAYGPVAAVQATDLSAARREGHADRSSDAATPPAMPDAPKQAGLTRLPDSALYRQHPEPGARYLVETDPRFANYRSWLSSDYLLQALALDPDLQHKRLGDGFHEQQRLREQVTRLTGQRYLADHASDEAQFQALMDNAVTHAQRLGLRPGVALSPDQVAQLTSDIVWLVTQAVTLPDGSRQEVLAPQLYARVRPGDVDGRGALLAGHDVDLRLSGDLTLSGTVAGRRVVQVAARNIRQSGGLVSGEQVAAQAEQDLTVEGGVMAATRTLQAVAGRDLRVATATRGDSHAAGGNRFSHTGLERVAGLYVSGPAGVLLASAGRDVSLTAAQVGNAGAGATSLRAGRDVVLSTVTTGQSQDIQWNAVHHLRQASSQEVGSQVRAAGSLAIEAGRDVTARAASVQSQAALDVLAGRDIRLEVGQATQDLDAANRVQGRSGLLASKTISTRETRHDTQAQATEFGGRTVNLDARQDVTVQGSRVLADADLALHASRDATIEAAQDTHAGRSEREEVKRGIFSGGGLGVTIGAQSQSLSQDATESRVVASTVGSVGGRVDITAGRRYTQTGSDVLTPQGDTSITAQAVQVQEGRESGTQTAEHRFRQSGLTVAVTAPVVTALEGLRDVAQAVGRTGSGRMQALGAATLALQANDLAKQAGAIDKALEQGKPAEDAAAVGISISVGSSSSRARQEAYSDTGRGSAVTSGGVVHIQAQGAGQDSDLTVQGSDIRAAGIITLKADDEVQLVAARNASTQTQTESSRSGSVGVAIQFGGGKVGFGVTASASRGRTNGSGESTTYTPSQVSGAQVRVDSGGDTSLRGAVVSGDQVTAQVGGDLVIQSLQDQARYHETSSSAGGSVMIGAGGGGSLNVGKGKIDSTYQSVTVQSGIRAGDGGFDVAVGGDTDLRGGAVTSTQAAVDSGRNRFSTGGVLATSDLANSARHEAKTASVGVGTGGTMGLTGAGLGEVSGSSRSTTTAGISGIAGDSSKRTGDAEQGIAQTFDKDRVKEEIAAQARITQSFGQQASRAAGEHADLQQAKLNQQAQQAATQGDTDRAAVLSAEAGKWAEGGAYRVALHAAIGGLSGGAPGAAGAAVSQSVVPQVGEVLKNTELPQSVKQGLVMAAGAAVGAALGGAQGGAVALNATANNYLSAADLRTREQRLRDARARGDVNEELRILTEFDRKGARNTGAISYDSVLTEQALVHEKQQLELLLKDATVAPETRAQAQRSVSELNTAINVLQRAPVIKEAAELGLVLSDIVLLGEAAAGRVLTSALLKEVVTRRTGRVVSDDVATAITNNFYRDGASVGSWTSTVQTSPGEAIFWSGKTNGVGGVDAAKQVADLHKGRTLEQLIESRQIVMPAFDPTVPASLDAWISISREFALNASGEVRAVLGSKLRPKSIWETVELPALLQNPKVTKIIVVDPQNGAERVLFQRIPK